VANVAITKSAANNPCDPTSGAIVQRPVAQIPRNRVRPSDRSNVPRNLSLAQLARKRCRIVFDRGSLPSVETIRLTRRNELVRCETEWKGIVYSVRIGPPQPRAL